MVLGPCRRAWGAMLRHPGQGETVSFNPTRLGCLVACFSALLLVATPASAGTIRIQGTNSEGPGQCIPFGGWNVKYYMGFVYRDVPPFSLLPGDVVAFDL